MRIVRLESRPISEPQPGRPGRPVLLSVLVAALLQAAVLLAIAQPAQADIGEAIILRCTHNEALSGFSQSAYRKALKELNADTEEYSGCSSLIREAQRAAAAGGRVGGGGSGGPSGAAPVALAVTPAEQRSITRAEHAGPQPVKLAGGEIHPGVVNVDVASALNSLPTPLLATLVFLLACLLLVAGGALRNRVRALRAD